MRKIIGHRGARGLAPENTVASAKKALNHQVDEVEIDVRITKDGQVVVIHDPWLTDPAGNKLRVLDTSYEELKRHKADLPTLGEMIESINRQVPLIIEVKPKEKTKPIVKIVKKYLAIGWQPSDFLFASFNYQTLKELHAALPEIPLIINERWSGVRAAWRAKRLGSKRLCMNWHYLWPGFIVVTHRSGFELYPYSMNDPVKYNSWVRYGLAGAVTDYPDRFHD